MNVGVDTPLDRRASSGASSCPENRVRFRRTLVQSALASPADIVPWGDELLVRLAPLSSPHRSRALAALCCDVNASAATFPGSGLRLRFEVADHAHRASGPDRL